MLLKIQSFGHTYWEESNIVLHTNNVNLLLILFGRLGTTLPSTLLLISDQVRFRILLFWMLGTALYILGIIYCVTIFDALYDLSM